MKSNQVDFLPISFRQRMPYRLFTGEATLPKTRFYRCWHEVIMVKAWMSNKPNRSEVIAKIKKLDGAIDGSRAVWDRAFWILCYCYFVNGKDEVVRWKQLMEAKLMASEALEYNLWKLKNDGYIEKVHLEGTKRLGYKITEKAIDLIKREFPGFVA